MNLSKLNIGIAITGSFCTFDKIIKVVDKIIDENVNLYPIFSYNSKSFDTRFYKSDVFYEIIKQKCKKEPLTSIVETEPIGPKGYLDALVIAPCTGNTIAKLANGITDTPVLMAAKAHLRNQKPLIIAVSTNDGLSSNFQNIGKLMNTKNIYFVPFYQDDYIKKPNSLVSDTDKIIETISMALENKQIEPVLCQCK